MSTFADRPNTALLVIDVQRGVVTGNHDRDRIVANIAALVDRARVAQVPVIWVQHNSDQLVAGEGPWQLVEELVPVAGEPMIQKRYGDAFEDTELEATLAALKVGTLLICGAQTDACIRSTLHGSLVRGYDAILVGDAHTTEDHSAWGTPPPEQVIVHTNLYWSFQQAPGRRAGTVTAAEVDFAAGV